MKIKLFSLQVLMFLGYFVLYLTNWGQLYNFIWRPVEVSLTVYLLNLFPKTTLFYIMSNAKQINCFSIVRSLLSVPLLSLCFTVMENLAWKVFHLQRHVKKIDLILLEYQEK